MRTGRPSTYQPDLTDYICERLEAGESLLRICSEPGMPDRGTVNRWLEEHEDFHGKYVRARDKGLDALADEVLRVSSTPVLAHKIKKLHRPAAGSDPDNPDLSDGVELEVTSGDAVDRSRLHVDTLKWYLSKLAPKRYGDRLNVEHSGSVGLEDILRAGRERIGGS